MSFPLTTQPEHPAPYIIHPAPGTPHKHTLILLHGTSTSGAQFADSFLSFPIPFPISSAPASTTTLRQLFPATRFVFPSGARKSVTVLGGRECNAWFDFSSFSDRTEGVEMQITGMRESVDYLAGVVRGEVVLLGGVGDGDEKGKVVLGGFSQGAAIAVLAVLSGEVEGGGGAVGIEGGGKGREGIAGLVGLSGYLPLRREIEGVFSGNKEVGDGEGKRSEVVRCVRGLLDLNLDLSAEIQEGERKEGRTGWDIPVFLAHGEEDVKMKLRWGEEMRDTLVEIGMGVVFKSYPGLEHWYSIEEMVDMVHFLRRLGIE